MGEAHGHVLTRTGSMAAGCSPFDADDVIRDMDAQHPEDSPHAWFPFSNEAAARSEPPCVCGGWGLCYGCAPHMRETDDASDSQDATGFTHDDVALLDSILTDEWSGFFQHPSLASLRTRLAALLPPAPSTTQQP